MFSAKKNSVNEVLQTRLEKVYGLSKTDVIRYDIALVWACALGYLDVVKLLLAEHPNILDSTRFFKGKTALMFAAGNAHVEVLSYLLAAGANPNLIDDYGFSALDKAARVGSLDCINALIKAQAYVSAKSIKLAEQSNHVDIANALRTQRYTERVDNLASKTRQKTFFEGLTTQATKAGKGKEAKNMSNPGFNPRRWLGL